MTPESWEGTPRFRDDAEFMAYFLNISDQTRLALIDHDEHDTTGEDIMGADQA